MYYTSDDIDEYWFENQNEVEPNGIYWLPVRIKNSNHQSKYFDQRRANENDKHKVHDETASRGIHGRWSSVFFLR
jgi:hypothetical protein